MERPRGSSAERRTSLVCAECGHPVDGFRYCPHCGQDTSVEPLRIGSLVSSFVGSLTSFEMPLLRTTAEALWRPGTVASSWIEGKRRTYASPMRFCIVTGIVVALALRFFLGDAITPARESLNDLQRFLSTAATEYFAFFAMVVLVPIAIALGVTSRLFRVERSTLDWYALGLYVIGISAVLQLVYAAIQFVIPSLPNVSGTFPLVWYVIGAWGFGKDGKRIRSVAACLAAIGLLLGSLVLLQLALAA